MEIFKCTVCGNINQSTIVNLEEEGNGYHKCLKCNETLVELVDNLDTINTYFLAEQIITENDNSLFY